MLITRKTDYLVAVITDREYDGTERYVSYTDNVRSVPPPEVCKLLEIYDVPPYGNEITCTPN